MTVSIRVFPIRVLCAIAGLMMAVLPPPVPAQPPLPDPIFDNGFDPANRPPVAVAGGDRPAVVGTPLLLDGSGSSDPDGDALGFAWSLLQRPAGSGAELFAADQPDPVLVPDLAGAYVVQLIVSDGRLFSAPVTFTATATGSLAASALIGPAGGAVGLPDGASVLVPPGALTTTVTVTIADIALPPGSILPPTGVLVGRVYEFTPNGQSFEQPVQIVVPHDPGLLPAGYDEGGISVYRRQSWPEFNMVGGVDDDGEEDDAHDHGQGMDLDNDLITVRSMTFSAYAAIGVRSSVQFTPQTLSTANTSVVVRRPPTMRTTRPNHHQCRAAGGVPNNTQGPLQPRTAQQIQGIVVHSTNNGNVSRDFNSELGWAADDCNRYFAHYYISRNGSIYQITDDLLETNHTRPSTALHINNNNAIGIELLNNTGEPYDGRQIGALIRLVDHLLEVHVLPRPQRDTTTGIVSRNRVDINLGGDRVVSHTEVYPAKCDPSGTFMDSGIIKPEHVGINDCKDTNVLVTPKPLSVGNSRAPALMDLLLDTIAVLDRDSQHTGIINTQGGDSFEVAAAGDAGAVSFREDATLVGTTIGTAERTRWEENEPTLVGPGPLIVAAGATMNLTGPTREYTDVIVAGTLNVTGSLELHVTGSVYVSPLGKLILRDGRNGANLTVYSRGTPVVQGLIDARGETGVSGNPVGGQGGNVSFIHAAPGILLVPTIYARGGDADTADVSLPGGGPRGGHGGAITIEAQDSQVIFGGGVGPLVGNTRIPTWHAAPIDVALLSSRWGGDYLPPAPPSFLSSFDSTLPANGVRPPLKWSANQMGFSRGLITTGGMGGVGLGTSSANAAGGPAGHGGDFAITLSPATLLSFRDIDIATGTEIETITHRYYLPPTASERLVCTASGAHGGFGWVFGSTRGNGGAGGNAGALNVAGGSLIPPPTTFVDRYTIQAFPSGQPLLTTDPSCSRGRVNVGQVIEARSSTGAPLYRLRLNTSRTALLGGQGGIPRGTSNAGTPGNVGPTGAQAAISGVPVQ